MSPPKATPMIQQYLSIKEQYTDAILFYRMGDFYEMFFEDAETASRVLEIALTARNKSADAPVPMCGVPIKAARGYIARLIESGFKVAVCEQVEDPAKAKGIVKREVVRVVTPGMIIEDELLDKKSNNFLISLAWVRATAGLSCLDISTGAFRVTESDDVREIVNEALRMAPKESLVPESARTDPRFSALLDALPETAFTFLEDKSFNPRPGRAALLDQFKTLSLEGFGCEQMTAGIGAAGALLEY
ncbi:MAG: DNA mismatch repair protein MutS, partial [Desulfobacterales bacterium]|nr:DNA mismatch repair protein MutS [Desulfobacterales bacterium]